MVTSKVFKKESSRFRNRFKSLLVSMTEKSCRKGWPNCKEESESSKLVEPVKLKSEKSKTEYKMHYVLLELLLMKVLL